LVLTAAGIPRPGYLLDGCLPFAAFDFLYQVIHQIANFVQALGPVEFLTEHFLDFALNPLLNVVRCFLATIPEVPQYALRVPRYFAQSFFGKPLLGRQALDHLLSRLLALRRWRLGWERGYGFCCLV